MIPSFGQRRWLCLVLLWLGVFGLSVFHPGLWAEDLGTIQGKIEYQETEYLVGPGDILSWEVLDEPDYAQKEVLVRPDGMATFVGVGAVDVSNLSILQITDLLTTRLKKTIREPEVSVAIKTLRPMTVYITGAVMQPGMLQFVATSNENNVVVHGNDSRVRTDMRLSNILANAGGVRMDADISKIRIKFGTGDMKYVDLWRLLKDGDIDQDTWVDSSAYIYVPQRESPEISDADYLLLLNSSVGPQYFPVRVIGEVDNPGIYNLDGKSPYLLSAISKAGGFSDDSNKDVVAIRRFHGEDGVQTIFHDLQKSELILKPNDIVFVSESTVYKTGRFAEVATKILSPFLTLSSVSAMNAQVFGYGGWNRLRRGY